MVDGTPNPTSTVQTGTGTQPSTVDDSELLADPATGPETSVEPGAPEDPATIAPGPGDSVITGSPGMSVDCEATLPCRWVSGDTQFTVTISNTDNIGAQGRLSIEYAIATSHDTEIAIASTEPATDDAGSRYEPSALSLGEGIGGIPQGVFGGTSIEASIEFDRSSNAATLADWTIGLSDAGLVRQPRFTGIPIGPATSQHAECANTLPCAWISPAGDVTVTLLSVTGSGSTNRLSTNFKIETTRTMVVAVDSGASAVGIDGLSYTGRTHAIGVDTGAQKLTAASIPGAQVAGTVFFFRTQAMSPALQHLSLTVYEDRPVPRWNPSFLSVPIQ